MDIEQVHDLVNRLVEAEFDTREAHERLERARQTNDPPPIAPSEFENPEAFSDFLAAKRSHEDLLQLLMAQREEAKALYDEAESALRAALPENTPLHYDYEGNRQELAGLHFKITNQRLSEGHSQITIFPSGPADE
jgi:hypothetical protein